MRRSATVTSSVPLASIAAASASSERKPPVPSSSRERSSRPRDGQRRRSCVSVTAIVSLPGSRAGSRPARPRAARRRPTAPRGTTSASTATATPRPAAGQVERVDSAACTVAPSAQLGVASPLTQRPSCAAPPRSGAGRRRAAQSGQRLAGQRGGDEVGGDRREQDAVAVVAGRPDQARRARRGRSRAGCRASPGAGRRAAPRSRARARRARARCRSRSSS